MLANISNGNILDKYLLWQLYRTVNFGVILMEMNYSLSVIIVHIT
jgi:hypothetical protein